MKKTLEKINSLVELGIIRNYAIGGAMGQFYYIEPSATYDLDVMLHLNRIENDLDPLREIYNWARKNNHEESNEHIIIDGIPVQFLLAYNELVSEAVDNANKITMFTVETYVMKQEYLMAIMLQTHRNKDLIRLVKFIEESDYDKSLLENIIKKYKLTEDYNSFKEKFINNA